MIALRTQLQDADEAKCATVRGNGISFNVGDRRIRINRGASGSVYALRRALEARHMSQVDIGAVLEEVGTDPKTFFDAYALPVEKGSSRRVATTSASM